MGYHFTDATGERWEIDVNVQTVIDCRKELEIDLNGDAKKIFQRIQEEDVEFVADLLFVVCRDQVQERGLTDRDFGRRLKGDTIQGAVKEFLRALADFFPKLRGVALRKAVDAAERAEARMETKAEAILSSAELDDAIEKALAGAEASMSSLSVSNSADRSESIPAP